MKKDNPELQEIALDEEAHNHKNRVLLEKVPQPLYRVRAMHSSEEYFLHCPRGEKLVPGMQVIANTEYGQDFCIVKGQVKESIQAYEDEVIALDHIPTVEDSAKMHALLEQEVGALKLCKLKVEQMHLDMQPISAHFSFDGKKVIFFFSASGRVDFRELVRALAAEFRVRIELRQVNARDEARIVGGLGICGRALCCHAVTTKLAPVTIKMAKDQNLTLNTSKLAGACDRLRCCIAFEHSDYKEARTQLPSEGTRFNYDGVAFSVIEVQALAGSVRVAGSDGRYLNLRQDQLKRINGNWQITSLE